MAAVALSLAIGHGSKAQAQSDWQGKLACDWFGARLTCAFQALEPTPITEVQIALDDKPLQSVPEWQPFSETFETGAVLWLVDVGNPAGRVMLAQQRLVLLNWLDRIILKHKLGVAAFRDVVDFVAPVGSDVASVRTAIQSLTTRPGDAALDSSIISGVRHLANVTAERKSLWLFTRTTLPDPGHRLENDRADNMLNVVREAQAAGVMVIVLLFSPSANKNPELQALRQLAGATHGYFVSADEQGKLPPNTLDTVLALVDGGGRFTVGLPEVQGEHRLTVKLTAINGSSYQQVLQLQGRRTAAPAMPGRPAGLIWIVFGLGGIALAGVLWLPFYRRRRLAVGARLVPVEGDAGLEQMPITKSPFRIGRNETNDMCLSNDSVSGHHVELLRLANGAYRVIDLESTNGLWINGERVKERIINRGDIMTLGEVKLRFLDGGK